VPDESRARTETCGRGTRPPPRAVGCSSLGSDV
jgi:hypothetical protein